MLNLNQSSLMIEGSLRGILSSQEGKSFEEIISFSKYIMEENKVAKLSEEIYKPDVEMNVDGIVDILITNIEMKWTEDDIFKIEESELFNDITKMNERNAVKVNNELARKRIRDAKQKAESKKVDEQKQPKQEKAKEEKKAEQNKQEPKTDSFRDILIKVNDELVRKRREEAKQKAESKKVDEQKQPKEEKAKEEKKETKQQKQNKETKKDEQKQEQPKEEKKAENTRVKEIFGRESMYNALGGKNVMTYEDYLEKLNTLYGFAHEDEMKYLCDVLNDLNDEEYKEIKSDVDNAKTEEDFMAIVAKIEMMRLTSKLGTKEQPNYEGFKSLIVDDFKVKNLTEDEMKTIYDVFIKALEDGEINDALDKALEQVNIKENRKEQKINRENDRPKNIHEEEWKRYFQLNLKNKKRGTMKGYLYKKAKLYRDSFGGNETPNNLVMRLNDIDALLGSCLIYDTTLTNNDSIMKAVAKYLETVLDKDNFSNSIMRDLIDRCLPQFEDIVING